jgi:esterase/lipase
MTRKQREHSPLYAGVLLMALLSSAAAQDVRGLEVCTAEKQMERRTGCLQANVEFLQQALTRLTQETQDKIAAAGRDLATAQTEITALKSTMAKLNSELARIKAKVETSGEK